MTRNKVGHRRFLSIGSFQLLLKKLLVVDHWGRELTTLGLELTLLLSYCLSPSQFSGDAPEELDGHTAEATALRVEHKMYDYEYQRERSARFRLAPGIYAIIPATYEPGVEAPFLLRLATEVAVDSGWDQDRVGNKKLKLRVKKTNWEWEIKIKSCKELFLVPQNAGQK